MRKAKEAARQFRAAALPRDWRLFITEGRLAFVNGVLGVAIMTYNGTSQGHMIGGGGLDWLDPCSELAANLDRAVKNGEVPAAIVHVLRADIPTPWLSSDQPVAVNETLDGWRVVALHRLPFAGAANLETVRRSALNFLSWCREIADAQAITFVTPDFVAEPGETEWVN